MADPKSDNVKCPGDERFRGECCCNCTQQIELRAHPSNDGFGKGRISEVCGYVCLVAIRMGENWGMFKDEIHGLCELHERKIDFLENPQQHETQ